jgi:hypothetical protein
VIEEQDNKNEEALEEHESELGKQKNKNQEQDETLDHEERITVLESEVEDNEVRIAEA